MDQGLKLMKRYLLIAATSLLGLGSGCKGPGASPSAAQAGTPTKSEAKSDTPTEAAEPAARPTRKADTADGPIRVGILHSLSGTMAISETSLKDVALMTIEDINAKGGVLGRQIEPIVVGPASNWPLSAEKARELLEQDVAVVFGCWTSVSRKSVLPVFEELNGLLF